MSWLPVLQIGKHHQPPSHSGYQFDLGEEMLRLAKVAPGQISRLRLSPLSKETEYIEDPLTGQIPFRAREISPEYSFRWLDTGIRGAMAWLQPELDEEQAQRAVARDGIRATLAKLALKTNTTLDAILGVIASNKTRELNARNSAWDQLLSSADENEKNAIKGQALLLEELEERNTGFLEEVPNLYDGGARGVRWNFSVANVEKVLLSSWNLQADQKQCFRIKRVLPLPAQGKRARFMIVIGNGWTQYALVFSKEEAVEFLHYRNMKPSTRAKLETELEEILSTGFLSAEDDVQIQEWQTEVALLQKDTSKSGSRAGDSSTQTKIADLKAKIKARRAAKNGLTDAMERRRDQLLQKLYYARTPISLQEDTRSLFEQDFTVTIGFHRRGFVSVRIGLGAQPGKEAFYYEVEGITKTGRPGAILPADSKIMLRSSGGAFGVVYGVADHAPLARLVTQPIEIPFEYSENDWKVNLDAIGLDEEAANPKEPLLRLPRCNVKARIELAEAGLIVSAGDIGGIQKYPKVRLVVEFVSEPHPKDGSPYEGNHDYGAEIYRVTAYCVAGEVPDASEEEWNSSKRGFLIEDLQLQNDQSRGATLKAFVRHSPTHPSGLPSNLEGRYFSLSMVDTRVQTRGAKHVLVRGGKITRPENPDARFFVRSRGGQNEVQITEKSATHVGGSLELMLLGLESIFDRPIEVPLIAKGARPNEYFREMSLVNGVHEDFLQGLPMGEIANLPRFPLGKVGSYPDLKPNVGDSLWQWMRDLALKHLLGWRLVCEGELGLTLENEVWRDRTDLDFRTDVVSSNPLAALRPLNPWQDIGEYSTSCTFIGAYNPGTGKRFKRTYKIFEADDERKKDSAFYIGLPKPYVARPDDSLRSDAACDWACRAYMKRQGLPPWYVGWRSQYDPTVREGDLVLHDGVQFVIWNLSYDRFARAKEQYMNATARLAQDVKIPQLEAA